MRKLIFILLLVLSGLAAHGQTFSYASATANTGYTSPTAAISTNVNLFTYYGFPVTNYSCCSTSTFALGFTINYELAKFPPVQVSFDFTGTNCEIQLDAQHHENGTNGPIDRGYYEMRELDANGAVIGITTNSQASYFGVGNNPTFTRITWTSNTTHHMLLSLKGGLIAIAYTNGTLAKRLITPKPNVLLVQGDSYTEGFDPNVTLAGGAQSFWFDGWVWKLGHTPPNTIVIPSGLSGTGFLADNGGQGVTYSNRLTADIITLYTNLTTSGLYNNNGIFIIASGTINDLTLSTNSLYLAVTNVYKNILDRCVGAKLFAVAPWLGTGGRTSPLQADWDADWAYTNAVGSLGITWVSPDKSLVRNAANNLTFFPGGTTDGVHPSAEGYRIYADFVNTNMVAKFGAAWSAGGTAAALNVTNYGAIGDAQIFGVNTVNGSAIYQVATPGLTFPTNTTIGKILMVYGAGAGIHISNNVAMPFAFTNQDIVCLITNVSQGTNLYGTIAAGWTTNAMAIAGTNNVGPFQAAINAAQNSVGSNVLATITIPSGNFLLIPYNCTNTAYVCQNQNGDGTHCLDITSGGITFVGSGGTNTILTGCGAGMLHSLNNNQPYGTYGWYVPLRGADFYCSGPITNDAFPLTFTGIVFDGGLTNGLQAYQQPTIRPGDGAGWDTSHHAFVDYNPIPGTPQMHQYKLFTNCTFQHWRGEMLICTTGAGGTNTHNEVANCALFDGNASAINLYYGNYIHDSFFTNLVKVHEYYQANCNTNTPNIWSNNVWRLSSGNVFTIVGSTTNGLWPSFTIISNDCALTGNGVFITASPAMNVYIIGNKFRGTSATAFSSSGSGLQPSDGSATINTNIQFIGNDVGDLYSPVVMDGLSLDGFYCTNNTGSTSSGQTFLNAGSGFKTNIYLSGNTSPLYLDATSVTSGKYPVDLVNNSFGSYTGLFENSGQTNSLKYQRGRNQTITDTKSDSGWAPDVGSPSLIPAGALLTIVNSTGNGANANITLPSGFVTLAPGATTNLYWNTTLSAWTNNAFAAVTGNGYRGQYR